MFYVRGCSRVGAAQQGGRYSGFLPQAKDIFSSKGPQLSEMIRTVSIYVPMLPFFAPFPEVKLIIPSHNSYKLMRRLAFNENKPLPLFQTGLAIPFPHSCVCLQALKLMHIAHL